MTNDEICKRLRDHIFQPTGAKGVTVDCKPTAEVKCTKCGIVRMLFWDSGWQEIPKDAFDSTDSQS